MSGTIIISYREGDAGGMAHRLHDRLEAVGYHCVFMTQDRSGQGHNYPAGREDMIAACDGFVAMVGARWLLRFDEHGRPGVHHRDDFTRKDIGAAIAHDIPILVVLAEGTSMPSAGLLPADLLLFAYQPSVALRGDRFDADAETLVAVLRRLAPA